MVFEDRGYNTREALSAIYGTSDPEVSAYWRNWAGYIGSSLPFIGDIVRSRDNWNFINDYMSNRGLSWSDVKYPSRVVGASTSGYGLNFVSSNVEKLYKNEDRMSQLNYDYNVFRLRRYNF